MSLEYWEYFLSIEADLERCSRFVDFSDQNYQAYSVEFARIIMAASAEVDTVAKELCKLIDPNSQAKNIVEYAGVILGRYSNLINVEISIPRYELKIKPWDGWSNNSSPDWWQSYNKIKHDRTAHFSRANLINSVKSVSGLLLLLLYYYKAKNGGNDQEFSAFYSPKLFDVVDNRPDDGMIGGGIFWGYYLP